MPDLAETLTEFLKTSLASDEAQLKQAIVDQCVAFGVKHPNVSAGMLMDIGEMLFAMYRRASEDSANNFLQLIKLTQGGLAQG